MMIDLEIYKLIPGYPNYLITSHGRVLNINKGLKELKAENKSGRKRVALSHNGCVKRYYVARLVAEAFIPKEDHQCTVIHLDDDLSNNHYQNLEWL